MIHLFHLWHIKGSDKHPNGAALLRETSIGFAACTGSRTKYPRDEMTAFLDDCTCPECIKIATEEPEL